MYVDCHLCISFTLLDDVSVVDVEVVVDVVVVETVVTLKMKLSKKKNIHRPPFCRRMLRKILYSQWHRIFD